MGLSSTISYRKSPYVIQTVDNGLGIKCHAICLANGAHFPYSIQAGRKHVHCNMHEAVGLIHDCRLKLANVANNWQGFYVPTSVLFQYPAEGTNKKLPKLFKKCLQLVFRGMQSAAMTWIWCITFEKPLSCLYFLTVELSGLKATEHSLPVILYKTSRIYRGFGFHQDIASSHPALLLLNIHYSERIACITKRRFHNNLVHQLQKPIIRLFVFVGATVWSERYKTFGCQLLFSIVQEHTVD